MYTNALFPVDGSDLALQAAATLRQVLAPDGRVLIVAVIDSVQRVIARTTPAGYAFDGFPADVIEAVIASQEAEAERAISAAQDRLAEHGIASTTGVILRGLPGPEIVGAATEHGCDVIVMATHGRSGLRRAVLGSVADHVVRHAPGVPVILLRPQADEDDRPD